MKNGKNTVAIILSVIVIIVFFALELLLGVERPVNKTMEIENLSEIMEKIDIEKIFRDENGVERAQGTRIYNYFDKIGLTREEVDSVVKDKSFKRIIGNYLGSMFINGVMGTEVLYPRKAELVNFIHNNYKHFQNVSGFPKDYKESKITEIVNDNYSNVKYELEELAKDIEFDEIKHVDVIKTIMTTKTIIIIGGLVLCIALLMILRHSLYRWLKWTSYPTMLSGLILLVVSFLAGKFMNVFVSFGKYDFIINPIIDDILKNMRLFGIIELVLGIVALVTYIVISKCASKKVVAEKAA